MRLTENENRRYHLAGSQPENVSIYASYTMASISSQLSQALIKIWRFAVACDLWKKEKGSQASMIRNNVYDDVKE